MGRVFLKKEGIRSSWIWPPQAGAPPCIGPADSWVGANVPCGTFVTALCWRKRHTLAQHYLRIVPSMTYENSEKIILVMYPLTLITIMVKENDMDGTD